jgi:hypothetical protein
MKYRATINIDFTKQKSPQYEKLVAALTQAGWVYLETSAFIIEGDLPTVLQGMELVAKQCGAAGELSALTYHIQGSRDFAGRKYAAARFHPNALDEIREKPLPKS